MGFNAALSIDSTFVVGKQHVWNMLFLGHIRLGVIRHCPGLDVIKTSWNCMPSFPGELRMIGQPPDAVS